MWIYIFIYLLYIYIYIYIYIYYVLRILVLMHFIYINVYANFQLVSTMLLSSRKFIEILIIHVLVVDVKFDFTSG